MAYRSSEDSPALLWRQPLPGAPHNTQTGKRLDSFALSGNKQNVLNWNKHKIVAECFWVWGPIPLLAPSFCYYDHRELMIHGLASVKKQTPGPWVTNVSAIKQQSPNEHHQHLLSKWLPECCVVTLHCHFRNKKKYTLFGKTDSFQVKLSASAARKLHFLLFLETKKRREESLDLIKCFCFKYSW